LKDPPASANISTLHVFRHTFAEEFSMNSLLNDGAASAPASVPLRVLVVDDDAGSATTLSLLIEYSGCHVRVARDGETALRLVDTFQPEAVVMDINLPGMDGYEIARRLRTGPSNRGVCLVALTGYGHEQDVERSYEAGFDHHFVKPTDPQVICDLLGRLAAGR
jgi:CheY-like chemotaxis protein